MSTTRQRAVEALASFKALSPAEQRSLRSVKHQVNTRVLTRNILAFFECAMLSDDGIPNFTMQEFTDSLADALLMFGNNNRVGTAALQTLVLELQDRVNLKLNPSK